MSETQGVTMSVSPPCGCSCDSCDRLARLSNYPEALGQPWTRTDLEVFVSWLEGFEGDMKAAIAYWKGAA